MTTSEPPQLSPNSARYWLPRIEAANLPTPKTFFVPYDHHAAMNALEGESEWLEWDATQEAVWEIAQRLGTAFVRTDLASAKHDGPNAYKISTRDDVNRVLSFTIQDNELKFWPTGPEPTAFLVREFLQLAAPFTAFGGHPIAREWRYFASADGVICRHFYWPEDSIEYGPDVDGWQKLLMVMASDPPPVELADIATRAATECPAAEAWSVDFAQDVDGVWHLVDMATAKSSWHPDHQ